MNCVTWAVRPRLPSPIFEGAVPFSGGERRHVPFARHKVVKPPGRPFPGGLRRAQKYWIAPTQEDFEVLKTQRQPLAASLGVGFHPGPGPEEGAASCRLRECLKKANRLQREEPCAYIFFETRPHTLDVDTHLAGAGDGVNRKTLRVRDVKTHRATGKPERTLRSVAELEFTGRGFQVTGQDAS